MPGISTVDDAIKGVEDAIKIAKAIKAIYEVVEGKESIGKLIDQLLDPGQGLDNMLTELNQNVITGFQDVVSAINNETLTNEWAPYSQTLSYIGTNLQAYQQAMHTLAATSTSDKSYTIVYNSNAVDFNNWCEGYAEQDGTIHRSSLGEMSSWLNPEPLHNSYLSLVGIFNAQSPNALDLIVKIAAAAQQDPAAAPTSRMPYDTQYNSVLRFMDCISKLVTITYYVHDSLLQLHNQILIKQGKPISSRLSVQTAISQNFGNVSTKPYVWHKFAQTLTGLATGSPQYQAAAFRPDMFPPTVATDSYERPSDCNWSFLPDEVRITDYYQNAFFTSIALVEVVDSQYPDAFYYNNSHVALQGKAVQVAPSSSGGAPSFSPQENAVPPLSNYENSNNWVPQSNGGDNTDEVTYTGGQILGTYEPSYAPMPSPSSNNCITVVTGFKLVTLNSGTEYNVAIALQFGELDISDPANPVVTIKDDSFIAPSFTQQSNIQQFIYTNFVGDYSTGENQHGVITNACLDRIGHDAGASCLSVQMAPTFYMADFYQPSNFKPIAAVFPTSEPLK